MLLIMALFMMFCSKSGVLKLQFNIEILDFSQVDTSYMRLVEQLILFSVPIRQAMTNTTLLLVILTAPHMIFLIHQNIQTRRVLAANM